MSAITPSNRSAEIALAKDREDAAAIAPVYRLAGRLLRRAVIRHLKARSIHELRSISPRIRADIGVPEHAIDDMAGELAQRRVDAWMKQVMLAA